MMLAVAFALGSFFFGPKKSKVETPADGINSGWLSFKVGEYGQALKIFKKVLKSAPEKSEYQVQASYGLGCTQWLKLPNADKPAAQIIFKDIVARFPNSDYAVWSRLALARMKHLVPSGEIPDYPPLRKDYQEIMTGSRTTLPDRRRSYT